MLKPILCLLMLIGGGGQADSVFKKEMAPLQGDVDSTVGSTGATIVTPSKATYLDAYGVVVMLEVMLEKNRNPLFSAPLTTAQVKASVSQRRKDVTEKLTAMLKDRVTKLASVGETESLTVIVYLSNTNPADVPDLPSQLVFSVKKDTPTQVSVKALE